jgi:hypothetical protein
MVMAMAATKRKTCPKAKGGCGRQFTPERGTRREKCYECSPVRRSRPDGVPAAPAAPVAPLPTNGEIAAAVRAELERVGKLNTVPGAIALRLARTLDDPQLGAAQVASISDKLAKLMEPLTRGGPRVPDHVDEITRRIAEKRASA